MRVLIISPRVPHANAFSGHQIVHQRMMRLLMHGHEVGIASFVDKEDAKTLKTLPEQLVEVVSLRHPLLNRLIPESFKKGRLRGASSFFRYYSPRMARRVGQMVAENGYDVVIAEYAAMGQFLARNRFLPAVRTVVSCHDSPTLDSRKRLGLSRNPFDFIRRYLEYRHIRSMEFSVYRHVDQVVSLTLEESRALLEEDPNVRTRAISPGLRLGSYMPMPEMRKEHAIIITGQFGNDQAHYGVMWFLRAVWPKVKEEDDEVCLYLVGRNPTTAMQQVGRKDPRVFVTGEVNELRPYLAKCKVFACPVLSGSGLRGKVLEAMAMELPVVTTSTGAEGIDVRMGDNAFVADTPTIMKDFLLLLLHDDGKARRVGEKARETVVQQFSWEKSMDETEKMLNDVVAKRSYHLT